MFSFENINIHQQWIRSPKSAPRDLVRDIKHFPFSLPAPE